MLLVHERAKPSKLAPPSGKPSGPLPTGTMLATLELLSYGSTLDWAAANVGEYLPPLGRLGRIAAATGSHLRSDTCAGTHGRYEIATSKSMAICMPRIRTLETCRDRER